jgi:Cu-Zn family superoxide dismutase
MKKLILFLLAGTILFFLQSCEVQQREIMDEEITPTKAIAILYPTAGDSANGLVTFTRVENGMRISAEVENLTPGKHGFHIHEYGDCSAGDATSAGGHFNPENNPHAGPTDQERHVGDLGNLDADENGFAEYTRVNTHIAFDGPNDIIGRAVVVHAQEDDFTSQPTGKAGARVACGVIGIVKE